MGGIRYHTDNIMSRQATLHISLEKAEPVPIIGSQAQNHDSNITSQEVLPTGATYSDEIASGRTTDGKTIGSRTTGNTAGRKTTSNGLTGGTMIGNGAIISFTTDNESTGV